MTEQATGKSQVYHRWEGRPHGPVLVLSHSLGCSCEMWRGQVAAWGEHFRILLYDHRGHGRSARTAGQWEIADFGRDLESLLDALSLDTVSFCGLSLGGMVGMWLAQNAPNRVERLVLCNTSARTEDPSLLRKRIELIERQGLPSIVENVLERWFTAKFRESHPAAVAEARTWLESTSGASYAATSRAVCELDLTAGLSDINAPTLVVYGAHDQATPPAWNLAIARAIPDACSHELPAAHLSNIEAAAEFNRAVLDFLTADFADA